MQHANILTSYCRDNLGILQFEIIIVDTFMNHFVIGALWMELSQQDRISHFCLQCNGNIYTFICIFKSQDKW